MAGLSDLDVTAHDRIIGYVLADQIGSIEVADDDTLLVRDPHGTSRRQVRRFDNLADAVQPRAKVDDAPHDAVAVKDRTRYVGNPIMVRPGFEGIAHRDSSFERRLEEAAISREDHVSVDHRPLGHSDVATGRIEDQDVVGVVRQFGLDGPENRIVLLGVRRIGGNDSGNHEQQGTHIVDVVVEARRCELRRASGGGPGFRVIGLHTFPDKPGCKKKHRQHGCQDENDQSGSNAGIHWGVPPSVHQHCLGSLTSQRKGTSRGNRLGLPLRAICGACGQIGLKARLDQTC